MVNYVKPFPLGQWWTNAVPLLGLVLMGIMQFNLHTRKLGSSCSNIPGKAIASQELSLSASFHIQILLVTLSLSLWCTCMHSLSLPLSLFPHSNTPGYSLSLMHTLALALSAALPLSTFKYSWLSLSHAHTCTRSLCLSPSFRIQILLVSFSLSVLETSTQVSSHHHATFNPLGLDVSNTYLCISLGPVLYNWKWPLISSYYLYFSFLLLFSGTCY